MAVHCYQIMSLNLFKVAPADHEDEADYEEEEYDEADGYNEAAEGQ
jgi:hypothetical protein